jgi:release factor glutamine methyltransferase
MLEGDLLAPVKPERFDLIVSNPPYISSAELELLQREVRDHEPRVALDGGPDGLAFYERLLSDAAEVLKPRGYLVVEIGEGQLDPIKARLGTEWLLTDITEDLQSIPRILTMKRAV